MNTTFYVRSVPVELHRQIKADAAANGWTLAQWLAVALEARRIAGPINTITVIAD